MVRFYALSCNLVCIVSSVFLSSICHCTEGKNNTINNHMKDYKGCDPSSAEEKYRSTNSTSFSKFIDEPRQLYEIESRRDDKRSVNIKSKAYPNATEDNENDGERLTNLRPQSPTILNDHLNNNASTNQHFSTNFNITMNKEIQNSQNRNSNEFATISTTVPVERDDISSIEDSDRFNADFQGLRFTSNETNRNIEAITTKGLTLMNLNGPSITQDVQSFEDSEAIGSNHIRVKRGSEDFPDGDESGHVNNELEDFYPNLIDDPLRSRSGIQLLKKQRINDEILLSKSETQSTAPEVHDYPILFDLNNKNSAELPTSSLAQPELRAEAKDSETDRLDFLNSATNQTTVENHILNFNSLSNNNSVDEENQNQIFKCSKKRCTRINKRKSSKTGNEKEHGKSHKPKHHMKRKKEENEVITTQTPEREERNKSNSEASDPAAIRAPTRKEGSNLISKLHNEYEASDEREILRLVDQLKNQAHVEKRVSGEAKSEIDMNNRDILLSRIKRTIIDEKNNGDCSRNGAVRYDYEDVHKPNMRTQRDNIALKSDPDDKIGKEKAKKSVKQIKSLMEKLFDKVNELEEFVNSVDNTGESKRSRKKAEESDFSSNTTEKIVNTNLKNLTKTCESNVCADEIIDASTLHVNEDKLKIAAKRLSRRQSSKKRKSHRKWDRWTDWSSCSVTCGKGRQIRWRHCIHDCTSAETEMEEKSCQLPACGPGKFLGIF